MNPALAFDVSDPFLFDVSIGPGDIDAQGHVNNTIYVQWMDRAAFANSAACGYDWERYQELGTSFVVRRHEIDYLAPALPGDEVVVATWPTRMRRSTAHRRHQIVRRGDGRTLVRALTQWVYVDVNSGRPARIPTELIEAFDPHED